MKAPTQLSTFSPRPKALGISSQENQPSHAVMHLRTISAEPIGATKASVRSRGWKSVDINSTVPGNPAQAIDDFDIWTAARAALSAKKRKEVKDRSNSPVDSVSALRHLCSKCQVFPVETCSSAPEPGRVWSSPFKRLIWHKNDCPFCSLLIRSLCEPENDPLRHPDVKQYLPSKMQTKSMDAWLSETSAEDAWMNTSISRGQLEDWPFGLQIIESESPTSEVAISEAAAQGFIAVEPSPNGDHSPTETSGQPGVLVTLPCYVSISNNPLTAGLLNVQLWGYGRGPKATIVALSNFRLRIESDGLSNTSVTRSSLLTYGRILDPSQIDLSIGRIWLDHCEQTHGSSCSKQGWPFRLGKPDFFRLIDVEDLSIIEVTNSTVWSYRYLTLSYVKGNVQMFELLQSNKHKLMRSHGLLKFFRRDLPKTLRDAINVTRGLEERYLWIDSLCIEQDNDLDKRKQINMMDRIFGNSILTIVAADAEDANVGLGGVERGSRHIRQISEEIKPDVRVMLPLLPPLPLDSSIWAHQTWTFQERLFSRRIVYFSGDQIHWWCHECFASEDMTAAEAGRRSEMSSRLNIKPQQLGVKLPKDGYADCSLRRLHDRSTHVFRSGAFKEYAQLAQQYSRRRKPIDAEVLDAISGLCHVFEICFKGPVRHGLPQVLLDAAILWRPAERLERRDCAIIPSWSWAGWKGEIKYASAFRIEAREDWSLQRVASGTGQEWFRPLLRWYIWQDYELKLLNGNGFGVPFEASTRHLPEEWEKYPPMMSNNSDSQHHDLERWDNIMEDIENLVLDSTTLAEKKLQVHVSDLPQSTLRLLGPQHLIFRTSCSKALKFGRISRSAVLDPKVPLKYPLLLGNSEDEVGSVRLDGIGPRDFDPNAHEFVVISEALYLDMGQAMPQDDKAANFPFYNVMLVGWRTSGQFASRLGLGRVYKEAWKSLEPLPVARTVILG